MELSLSVRPDFNRSATRQSRLSHMADAAEVESLAIMRLLSHGSTPVVAAVRMVSEGEERGVPFDFECGLDSLDDSSSGTCFLTGARRPWAVARFDPVRADELYGNDHLGSLPRSFCRTTHSRT